MTRMPQPDLTHTSAMREMPETDRPRERLARVGPEALRDAELIAILFRTGTRSEGAVALGERVMRHFGDLRGLARASLEEIQQVNGVGKVKAVELKAAIELGKRLATHVQPMRPKIRCAQDVADLLMTQFKEYETEHFKTLLLNTKNEVLKVVTISQGRRHIGRAAGCLPPSGSGRRHGGDRRAQPSERESGAEPRGPRSDRAVG